MTKSIAITNEMRGKIADELTVQAVAKHGPKISAKLEKLNAKFWQQHLAKVDRVSMIKRENWPALIQAGVVSGVVSVEPEWEMEREGMSPAIRKAISIDQRHSHDDDLRIRIFSLIKASNGFAAVQRYIVTPSRHYSNQVLKFVHQDGTVPRLNGMERLPADSQILATAKTIESELIVIIDAAMKFRAEVMSVLWSCRTSRQLEDLLPEAAKLLPPPVEQKAVVPVEQARAISAMLKAGVPPVSTAEVAL